MRDRGRLRGSLGWILAATLLLAPFALGYLRGSAGESTAESVSHGVGTVLGALAFAAVLRLGYWLVRRRATPYLSPWLLVIAAVIGVLAVIGSVNSERQDREEEATALAKAAARCAGNETLASRFEELNLREFSDPEIGQLLTATGIADAVEFYEARLGRGPRLVVAFGATGNDPSAKEDFISGVVGGAENSGLVVRQEETSGVPVTVVAGAGPHFAAFTTDCYGVMVYGTTQTRTLSAAKLVIEG